MSVQASIDLKFDQELDFLSLLNLAEGINWTYNDYGKITYLDNDDFEWKRGELSNLDKIKSILENRFKKNELAAIAIVHESSTGLLLHFMPNKTELMLSLNINRKTVKENFTDFSFYLSELSLLFNGSSSIVCSDVY